MAESKRRRGIQEEYNKARGITPATVKKRIRESLSDIYGSTTPAAPLPGLSKKEMAKIAAPSKEYMKDPKALEKEVVKLRKQMKKASDSLEFEEAARLRDEVKRLELVQLSLFDGDVDKEFDKALIASDSTAPVKE